MEVWRCQQCARDFETQNSLNMHKQSHLDPDIKCVGRRCSNSFKTYGGMIIHLEYGTCVSGMDRPRLNKTAALCFQWKKYVVRDARHQLLDLKNPNQKPFFCPDCDDRFHKLSSLFQHIETDACDQDLNDGAIWKLRKWLKNRHG